MKACVLLFAALAWLPAPAPAAAWEHDTTVHGVAFKKSKTEPGGLVIGLLPADRVISGRPCRRGWVHLHPNGNVARFTAAEEIVLERFSIPAGTWVSQDQAGSVLRCAFPRNTRVQGHHCRGTGGPKGVQAAFYPSGALKAFYLVRPTRIGGVPCDRGAFRGIVELHEDGRLKSCLLADDFAQGDEVFRRGRRIEFDAGGRAHASRSP